jgi:hypothetical protein
MEKYCEHLDKWDGCTLKYGRYCYKRCPFEGDPTDCPDLPVEPI